MQPPALPRTVSPIWSDLPAFAGDAEQMEEYLSGELTRYVAYCTGLPLAWMHWMQHSIAFALDA